MPPKHSYATTRSLTKMHTSNMKLFDVAHLQEVIEELRSIACSSELLGQQYYGSTDATDSKFTKRALGAVRGAIEVAEKHDFTDAVRTIYRAENELRYPREFVAIKSETSHVADALCDELQKRSFFLVAAAHRDCVENSSFMGQHVSDAFPSAVGDIKEAGNCLGAECNTAAVFHLMRVVELGLRALCAHMGLHRIKRARGRFVPYLMLTGKLC